MTTPPAAAPAVPYVAACPVCGGTSLVATEIKLPEGALRRCTHCGQLLSAASESRYWETMASFNAPGYNQLTPREFERRRKVAQRRLKTILHLLARPAGDSSLVDIGCSRGQFVDFAAREGFIAEGVEPAPEIAAAARHSGLKVRTGLLEDQHYADATFDAASLIEVVEHLREPAPLLRECRRILKPGGILVISTGNAASWTVGAMGARWDYFHMDQDGGHISFFNPQSITILAHACGFEIARIETARVKFHEKGDVSPLLYTTGKIAAELLNLPARLAGRGHDILAYLRCR